jgi:type II secretory pathway component PulF
MSDNALSRTTFWLLLLVHCVPGVVLFALLVGCVPRFAELFDNLHQRGELPLLTVFVLLLSRCWYWLLLFGSALDVAVLYVLSRLPRRLRWLSIAWFGSVLAAIVVLCVLIILGLLAPMLKISTVI